MGKRVLKDFIQCLQNRVIVAVSLTIIKSKPADITVEQHAESIQQLVYDNWVKDSYVSSFENKIIELQHEKLFREINELLGPKEHFNILLRPKGDANLLLRPMEERNCFLKTIDESFHGECMEEDTLDESLPGFYLEDNSDESFPGVCSEEDIQDELFHDVCSEEDAQDELIPGVCTEEYSCDELNGTDSDFDDNDLFEHNVSFIQAIIQLKFPVFSRGCITLDIINNLLDKFVKNENLHSLNNVVSVPDGSGFGELSACTSADLNVDQIRIIINSSRTEFLIKKCLTSALHFAYKSIHNNTEMVFYSWHGSLIEYLCSVLEDISFHPVCTDYLSKLILKSLDDIWSSEDSYKHILWEHQLHILSVFCVNSHVCESVIDFIIVKFDFLIDLLNKIQIGTFEHLVCIHLIEKLPHFTRFLCMVIKKLRFYKVSDIYHTEDEMKYNKSVKVIDLWKLKWRVNSENHPDHKTEFFEGLLKRWKDICEKLIIISVTNFPLISVHIWDIMTTLQDWNTEIPS